MRSSCEISSLFPHAWLSAEEHLGVLALTNATPLGLPESICLHFLDLVHYGKPQRDYLSLVLAIFKQMTTRAGRVAQLCDAGAAEDGSAGEGSCCVRGDLHERILRHAHGVGRKGSADSAAAPRDANYELSHWDSDTFTCYFASESTGLSRRGGEFSPGKNQVLIENLAPEHDAVFTRAKAAQ